jgi:hypothetical protein
VSGPTYRTFFRSARNFTEFSRARKRTQDRGLTYSEAQRVCENYNADRTPREVSRGTKLEFEREN